MLAPTEVPEVLRVARLRAGLSLRAAAVRAGTSHATLAAYEQRRKSPTVATLLRVLGSYGFSADIELSPRIRGTEAYPRGKELVDVLDLAEEFPARHAKTLRYPRFGKPCPR